MSSKTYTWLLAAGIALVLAASYLLDVPSEQQLAESTALSVKDAQAQAAREARTVRAELAAIEPTPAHILHQYAALSGVVK